MKKEEMKGLVIKFGGDVAGLVSASQELNSNFKKTQNELKQVEKLLKLDPSSTEMLKQKQQLLSEAVGETKDRLSALKQAKEKLDAQMQSGTEVDQSQYRALQREIEKAEIDLKEATGQAKDFDSALKKTAETAEKIGEKTEQMGKKMLPITAAIAGVGIASGKMALTFEDAMANINTLLDDETHLESYEKAVKDISNETGQQIDTVASGMYQAISSIGDGADTQKIFKTMARSAKAGGAEVSESVSLLSAGMKGYNQINDATAQKLSDLAFQTAKLGVTTFPEMAKSMQPLFPLANSLNMSYEELFGVMATGTGVTGNTAEVTTQFKAILSGLMKPTADMQALISKYGFSNAAAMLQSKGLTGVLQILKEETGGQSDKLATLFGSTEALTLATALTGSQFDTFKDKLGQMGDATGATETAYEKLDTKGNNLRETINRIRNTGVELGQSLMSVLAPIIETVSEKVKAFSDWFGGLNDKQKETIIKVAAVVAAIGPALIIIGKVATGVSSVIGVIKKLQSALTILMAHPVVLIIAAVVAVIAALTAGFIYLWKNCEGFRNFWLDLGEKIKEGWNAVMGFFKKALDFIKNNWQGLLMFLVNPFVGGFKLLYDNCDKFRSFIDTFIEKVKTFFKNGWNDIVSFFTEKIPAWIDNMVQWFKDIPERFLEIGKNIIRGLWDGILNMKNWLKEKVTGFFDGMVTNIKDTLRIHSPSRRVASEVGEQLPPAIPIGMKAAAPNAIKKVKLQTENIFGAIKAVFAKKQFNMQAPQLLYAGQSGASNTGAGAAGGINEAVYAAIKNVVETHGHDIRLNDETLVGKLSPAISKSIGQKQWMTNRGIK